MVERISARYPHLREPAERIRREHRAAQAEGCNRLRPAWVFSSRRLRALPPMRLPGRHGIFDLFAMTRRPGICLTRHSLLSLEEYALQLASEGQLDLDRSV